MGSTVYPSLFMTKSAAFNIGIIGTILFSSITIALETTYLNEEIPTFFVATDFIYVSIFMIEFILKVITYHQLFPFVNKHILDLR